MKCKVCGASDREGRSEGITLECEHCGEFPDLCQCHDRLGRTPKRWIHCLSCDRHYIGTVDTSKHGWRSGEV